LTLRIFKVKSGRRFGFEFKFSEALRVTRSAHTAISDLQLDHVWVVHPGEHAFPIEKKITAMPLTHISELPLGPRQTLRPVTLETTWK
jgi:hypothetical protein